MNKNKRKSSITCEEALERMFEYIDNSLSKFSEAELERHIEKCSGCMQKLDFQLKLKQRMAKIRPLSVSKKLAQRLNLIIEQQKL